MSAKAKKIPPRKLTLWGLWLTLAGLISGIIFGIAGLMVGRSWALQKAEYQRQLRVFERRVEKEFQIDLKPLYKVEDPALANIIGYGLKAYEEYEYDKAIAYFSAAMELTTEKDTLVRLTLLNLKGINQYKSGATRDAEQTFLEIIRIAEQAKLDEALSLALNNIGNVYYTFGKPHKALDYFQKALRINEKIGKLQGQAINLGNIGIVYRTLGEPRKALGYYEKALVFHKKIGSLEGQAQDLGNIGNVYRTLGKPHKALDYFQKALRINEKIGKLQGQAINLGNIGNVYNTLGESRKALECYEQARAIFVRIGAKHMVEQTDHNIAVARQKLAEQEK